MSRFNRFRGPLTTLLLLALLVPFQQSAHGQNQNDTIVDVAVNAGGFETLVAAVKAAGLVNALSGDGPLTVFAPTDEAFSRLPEGTVASLLLPENKDQLVAILTYHVVPGRIEASDLLTTGSAKTLNGESADIGLRIGRANIVATDINASNGIIHVIDEVLLPASFESSSNTMAGRLLIDQAIMSGAPLFNMGQSRACAAVYEVATRALLALDRELPSEARAALIKALDQIASTPSWDDRAWVLRDGLDAAYTAMTPRVEMSTKAGKSDRH